MAKISPKKIDTVCCRCGKKRGKFSRVWPACSVCGKPACHICRITLNSKVMCSKCGCEELNKQYNAKEEERKSTPIECTTCHCHKLPKDMENPENPYVPSICKSCAEIKKKNKERDRKNNAQHGLVEVRYGEHPAPEKEGETGYSYYYDQPLDLGDIVEVPQTWMGKARGEIGDTMLATVVSAYSDYSGPTTRIIRIVKKAGEERIAQITKME